MIKMIIGGAGCGMELGHQFKKQMITGGVKSGWHLSKTEIEYSSPSRKDGIDLKKEAQLRKLYCSFVQDVGMRLKLPHVTISTAIMLCHRFYLHQSHARNEWQTIATVSIFLASKVEETPRFLRDVIVVAYETMYRRDSNAAQRIRQKEVYEKRKELILLGETLLLATIGFDMNIQHPYEPLMAACKRLKISQNIWKTAWMYVNDWLRTTICLQYKPHYVAAGSLFLAAKFHRVKLSSEKGMVWWQQFDVSPQHLEEVIRQMQDLLNQNRKAEVPCTYEKTGQTPVLPEKAASISPPSSVLSASVVTSESTDVHERESGVVTPSNLINPAIPCSHVLVYGDANSAKEDIKCRMHDEDAGVVLSSNSVNHDLYNNHVLSDENSSLASMEEVQCHTSDCGSTHSVVEDSERFFEVTHDQALLSKSDQVVGGAKVSGHITLSEMDKHGIRMKLKRRRLERATDNMVAATNNVDYDDVDAWIEKELEDGIQVKAESPMGAACNDDDDDDLFAWIERELESGIEVKVKYPNKKLKGCEIQIGAAVSI